MKTDEAFTSFTVVIAIQELTGSQKVKLRFWQNNAMFHAFTHYFHSYLPLMAMRSTQ